MMINQETRASLILRLGDPADDEAWDQFLTIYEPMLFSLASRWGLQAADAQEVVQETLLGVSKSIDSFQQGRTGSFRAWLSTITRNKLADHLAKSSRQTQGSGDTDVHRWLNEQANENSSASVWDWQHKKQVFAWAANRVQKQVSWKTWQAFHRTSVLGDSIQEVAADLRMQEGMVYVARSRVMARLRQAAEQWAVTKEQNDEV